MELTVKKPFMSSKVEVGIKLNWREYSEKWTIDRFFDIARQVPVEFWISDCMVSLSPIDRVKVEDEFQALAQELGFQF